MAEYFYARVSSREQNLARQMAIAEEGDYDEVFCDKQSGKDFERPEWERLIKRLKTGDCLTVVSLDRIGRNYVETPEQWKLITKDIGADIVVLDMPLLDTRKKGKDLTGTFVADLVLQVLSYVAQTERENAKKRQQAGIEAMPIVDGKRVSSKTGRGFGRQSKCPTNFKKIANAYKQGEISLAMAVKKSGVSRASFYNYLKQCEG